MILIVLLFSLNAFSSKPILPEDVLTKEEIAEIHKNNNYFLYKDIPKKSPIWEYTNRRYGSHLFKERTEFLSLSDVVRHVVTDGFPIKYRLQNLYQAKLGIHSQIGNLVPSITLSLGNTIPGFFQQTFSSLFGFINPATWLNLKNQTLIYKATKLLLAKDVFDQILQAKVAFYNQHQNITDFEILNFYYIHLKILADRYGEDDRHIATLLSEFAFQGTDMASKRGDTKLGFDDLALVIALEKLKGDYTLNNFNIHLLNDFPEEVKDLEYLPWPYNKKSVFLEEVVKRSVELRTLLKFLDIAKNNVGLVALGQSLQQLNVNNNGDFTLALKFGYGLLPNILISKSNVKVARIDIEKGYIQMLDFARRSFDFYTNGLGGYTESKRAIKLSREALAKQIEYLIETGEKPDADFIFTVRQNIQADLKENGAFHNYLRADAFQKRYLLEDPDNALSYLPQKKEILSIFRDIKNKEYKNKRKKCCRKESFRFESVGNNKKLIRKNKTLNNIKQG